MWPMGRVINTFIVYVERHTREGDVMVADFHALGVRCIHLLRARSVRAEPRSAQRQRRETPGHAERVLATATRARGREERQLAVHPRERAHTPRGAESGVVRARRGGDVPGDAAPRLAAVALTTPACPPEEVPAQAAAVASVAAHSGGQQRPCSAPVAAAQMRWRRADQGGSLGCVTATVTRQWPTGGRQGEFRLKMTSPSAECDKPSRMGRLPI
ncbi:unnamed protein product [Lampetra fluviatilis]